MSRIITFCSYKGGVGSTFALANIAVLLANQGQRVLLMDWDLETPGLHRYFIPLSGSKPLPQEGLIHLLSEAAIDPSTKWDPFVSEMKIQGSSPLQIMTSGDQAPDYRERIRLFSWASFFKSQLGGEVLDRWREQWKQEYDFVLVDAGSGLTDTGGVCTVLLSDILVLVFSTNEQSFRGGIQIAYSVQDARGKLAVPRPPVAILPLPGRFDERGEIDEASRWLDRFAQELKPFYDDWLPTQFKARQILQVTKIPYVTRFSFGEPLAVISHSVSDTELPGLYLSNVARLLASDFHEAAYILSPRGADINAVIAEFHKQLGQMPINEGKIKELLSVVEARMGKNTELSGLLNAAGFALFREMRYEFAKAYFQRGLAIIYDKFGPDHPSLIEGLNYLGKIFLKTREFATAAWSYCRALKIVEKNFPLDDTALTAARDNLATVAREASQVSASSGDLSVDLRETIEIYEQLAKGDRTAYGPALAGSLNNLSNRLAESGEWAAALHAIRRAVEIHEQLAADNFAAYGAGLATSLDNLSNQLAESGERAAALHAIRRAVEIHEQLAADNFAAYRPALAESLNNLSNRLADNGQREAALHVIRRAVEIHEQLATDNFAAYGAGLAASLDNLSNRLVDNSEWEAGLGAIQRAVEIIERLAADDFGAYGADLARSLNNLSNRLAESRKRAAALRAIWREVEIQERLAADNFGAYGADLARSLNNLSNRLAESGEQEAALQAIRREVKTQERLAGDNFGAYGADLARSLNNLSNRLAERGEQEAALQAIRREVEIQERLAVDDFGVYGTGLARSLNNLSNRLAESGEQEAALQAIRREVEIQERLAADNFGAYGADLARSLNNLSNRLTESGEQEAALQATQRAVEIQKRRATWTTDNFTAYAHNLSMNMNELSNRLAELDKIREAGQGKK